MGESVSVALRVEGLEIPRHFVLVIILTETGMPVATLTSTQRRLDVYEPTSKQDRVVLEIPHLPLAPGHYSLRVEVKETDVVGFFKGAILDRVEHAASFEVVPADVFGSGYVVPDRFRAGIVFMDSLWEVHSGEAVVGATRIPSFSSSFR